LKYSQVIFHGCKERVCIGNQREIRIGAEGVNFHRAKDRKGQRLTVERQKGGMTERAKPYRVEESAASFYCCAQAVKKPTAKAND
jgi:hypothetical protein